MTEFTFYCLVCVRGGDKRWLRQTFSHETFFKVTDDLRDQGNVYFSAIMREHAPNAQCPVCGADTKRGTPVEIFGSLLTRPNPHAQDISVATLKAIPPCERVECRTAVRAYLIKDRNVMRERLRENGTLVLRRVCCVCRAVQDANPPVPFKKCARCRGVYYCGKKCQRADWAEHQLFCVPPVAEE
jgi:hypothetical protein